VVARPQRGVFRLFAIAAPPDGEACARPARPTRSLRTPHRHDFDARAFTRALYAGGQNHSGPANVLSGASRLSGLCASLRPSFVAATALRQKVHAAETPPPHPRDFKISLLHLKRFCGIMFSFRESGLWRKGEKSNAPKVNLRCKAVVE